MLVAWLTKMVGASLLSGYPILSHTVFKYAGSARLMGKSGGCGT
jgi:hypothetical protein